jgi:C4-dicarboxylate-binding protein DctP
MANWFARAAVAAALCAGSMTASAETITVTTQLPETHFMTKNWEDFGDLISKASGGELDVQVFASAQLFKDDQVPEAVGSGAVNAGSVSLARYAGSLPAINVTAIPFVLDSEEKLREAIAPGSELRQILDEAILEATNNRVLWWQFYGRNIYLADDQALKAPSDFVGKKVRSYGKLQGWTVEALGGAPTLISGSEQFLAYQQGTVDVGMTGSSSVETRKLYEVMNTLTRTYDSAILWAAVINNDYYESLSEEHQQMLQDAAKVVEADLTDYSIKDENDVIERLRDKMNVVELTESERQAFREATEVVRERFLEESGELGAKALKAIEGL